MCNSTYSNHAKERSKQRKIQIENTLTIEQIKRFPKYMQDKGCVKYLDMKKGVIYYLRDDVVVTVVKSHNPIQMLKNYAFGAKLNFNELCRDHVFNNCNRKNCKFIHINL